MRNGGKASSLIRLREGGFPVPPFFVCDQSWTDEDISNRIDAELPWVRYFAVRSSAENEDSAEKSFAGHFYSAVGILKRDVSNEVRRVQRSFGTYPGSVIIQEFIPSDCAGVLFTEVEGAHIVINAAIGLCLSVVNGEACDEYIFTQDGTLVDQTIPAQKHVKLFRQEEIVSTTTNIESLTNIDRRKALIQLAKAVQHFFGQPQDIEWCFLQDKLYILQSRPITKTFTIAEKTYFDSANIAESYSGIVLPLTCSFAQLVYEQVYRDLLRMSGVSAKKLARHTAIFKHLLGFFYGRMYYNMNSWYHMTAFVPGYNRNKENFEQMITSNVKQDVATPLSPSFGLKLAYPFIVVIKTCFFGFTSRYFTSLVKRELRALRARDVTNLSYEACIQQFNALHRKLLRRWYIAIENDFFVMTYLGLLKKLLDEKMLQELMTFRSKATEQTEALMKLSRSAKMIEPLWRSIQSHDARVFHIERAKHSLFDHKLTSYLTAFGGRFANELKLESLGIDEDATKLLSLLLVYHSYEPRTYTTRKTLLQLPFFKKILVRILLGKFKKYASRREEFRLLRSTMFAVVRSLVRRMGDLLAKDHILQDLNDIFYLQLEEVLDPKAVKNQQLPLLVEQRKRDYLSYENVQPPAHFASINNKPPSIPSTTLKNAMAQGRPASPGIIRGRVKIFKEFSMPTEVSFDILVTTHTDPGWTSLIALSKGLIIEYGGVLSHASIVARELGIPAVIGATNAVEYLKDGQLVEINGSTGAITLL